MSFNVGMPMLGLKRGSAKGKHAGNLRKILDEMGTERYSATKSFDPSKSEDNIHLGQYASGEEAYAAIMSEIEDYEVEYKKTSYRGRGLRADATVAVALIVKPEGDWINEQPPEVQEKFFSDSYEVLCELGVINADAVRMRERHHDEASPHEHIAFMGYDKDGKLAGSRIVNLKTFKKLNRDYPKLMRERGWEVNELKAYDAEAVKDMTPEEAAAYKAEHIEKKHKRHGLSANEYAAMKETERLNAEVNEMIGDLEDVQERVQEAQGELDSLEPKRRQAKKDIEDAEKMKKEARDADYEIYCLARNVEASMGMPKSARPLSEVIKEAEQRYREMEEVSQKIATATERLAQKEQKANQLLDDLEEAKQEQPSSKESWMLNWLREKVPKAYAACEKAYEAFKRKTDSFRQRKREIFGLAEELEQKQQVQDHHEKDW